MDNFLHRELNPCLLQCKQGVLTTGPTGKFELIFFFPKEKKKQCYHPVYYGTPYSDNIF